MTGILAVPMIVTTAQAITYTDVTWAPAPANILFDDGGNPYAMWDNPANWSGGNVPSVANPVTGNPDKLHFNQPQLGGIPCVIDNFAANLGMLVIGDWGPANGTGTIIVTNGGSLVAGCVAPGGDWSGVGFPQDNCVLYIAKNSSAAFGSHLWVGNGTNSDGTSNSGTVIVDGGTLSITNGQLGLGWNGTGGTNYMVVTNGGKVYLRNWASQTLGQPGNNSRGQLDLATGGSIIVGGNATAYFQPLVNSGQLTGYGGAGTVSWSFDPVSNTTTLIGVAPVTAQTPVISGEPTNVVVGVGGTASFSVNIANVPCNYQWFFNNQPLTDGNGISGSTTAKLTLANVSAASAGVYSVYATNKNDSAYWVHSSGASLTTEAFSFYPVITVTGVPGNTYEVDYTPSLTPPVTWTLMTTITLGGTTHLVVDTASPMSNTRFYRVVQH
jgi:Immunoglobulin domain